MSLYDEPDYTDLAPTSWDEQDWDDRPLWDRDFYDYQREIAERDAADEWCEGYDRLRALGVLTSEDDHTNTTLAEIRRLVALLGEYL